VDAQGNAVLRKKLERSKILEFSVSLPPCLIGMETCHRAHFWAGKLRGIGQVIKLMTPQFVMSYFKTNKNDAADADAIFEAVTRPSIRFVPIKSDKPQAILCMPRGALEFCEGAYCPGEPDSRLACRVRHL
jgi:transposase